MNKYEIFENMEGDGRRHVRIDSDDGIDFVRVVKIVGKRKKYYLPAFLRFPTIFSNAPFL